MDPFPLLLHSCSDVIFFGSFQSELIAIISIAADQKHQTLFINGKAVPFKSFS